MSQPDQQPVSYTLAINHVVPGSPTSASKSYLEVKLTAQGWDVNLLGEGEQAGVYEHSDLELGRSDPTVPRLVVALLASLAKSGGSSWVTEVDIHPSTPHGQRIGYCYLCLIPGPNWQAVMLVLGMPVEAAVRSYLEQQGMPFELRRPGP